MKHGLSISLRLTLWFSAIFLCGCVAFAAALWFDLASSLEAGRDKTLTRRGLRMAELLGALGKLAPEERLLRARDFADGTPEGRLIHVLRRDGQLLLPALLEQQYDFPWPAEAKRLGEYRGTAMLRGEPYRVYARDASYDGEVVRVLVAGQLRDNRVQLERFKESLIRLIPLVIIGAAFAGYFVSRKALNPVARLIDSGRSITIGNLSRRLPVSGNGDELARLAETWNSMLERLESSVNRITRFTADASHELRTPLTFIRMAAESLAKQPGLDAETAEGLREIVAEAGNAAHLLEDMLMLARSDAGHTEVVFGTVSLGELVSGVASKARVMAEEKEQRLEQSCESGPLEVYGDANLLRRLTWILLDNAVRYTPPGGRIDVTVRRSPANLALEVSDSGRGIPPEALSHIFERFYRVDPARSDEEGTGLGLAIAKWIADSHRADITVASEIRKGTTFRVLFPPVAST